MPLYEYRCEGCGKRFTFLYGVVADNVNPKCPRCGSSQLKKLISRTRRLRGEDEILEGMVDSIGDIDETDTKAIRKFIRRMGKELGSELGEDITDELEAAIEEEEKGKSERGEEIDERIY
ncbi:MAG: zinc ribbon domain-containing protein [Armatimonadota bacterium]|nr:zinc ribbon domain-containing protein [Armatimonadota bacterium]MCX7777751.1 zinc ribbon domain-containing protein [Armatimonadota bacterium]MDW8026195.1 zinc ribbon domain-containing protein [Armatimonadota bacterium]